MRSPDSRERPFPRRWRTTAGLACLAGAHAAVTLAISPDGVFGKYPRLADRFLRGELNDAEVSDASPGYLLLSLLLAPRALRLLQAVVAAIAIVLVYRIAASARGVAAGWVAACSLAAAQTWLFYSALLEPDLLIAGLDAIALAMLLREGTAWRAAAGGALGLSCALRPTAAPLAVASLAWIAMTAPPARRAWAGAGAFCAALVVCAAVPFAALVSRGHGEWRSTMSAGQNVYLGHRPEGSGLGYNDPSLLKMIEADAAARPGHKPDFAHELYRRFAAAGAANPVSPADASAFWIRKALAFAREHPGAFARQLVRKWVFTLTAPNTHADVPAVTELQQSMRLPALPQHWIALAGFAGLLLCVRRGRIERLIATWVICCQLVSLIFFHQTRYGVSMLPLWCALAGCGAAAVWRSRHARRVLLPRAAVAVAPFALLLLPFVRFEARLEERNFLVPAHSRAAALRNRGEWSRAAAQLVEEQASFPDYLSPWSMRGFAVGVESRRVASMAAARARARFGTAGPADAFLLAVLHAQAGRCDLAVPLAESAAREGFHGARMDISFAGDLLAADCLRELGQPAAAFQHILRSLDRWPGTLDGLARAIAAGETHPELGAGVAERWMREMVELHDPVSARFALARERARWGAPGRALEDADWVAGQLPDAAPFAHFQRALCLLDLGHTAEALGAYAQSLPARVYLYGTDRFDEPIRERVQAHPHDRVLSQIALAHWLRQGRVDEVRALLRRRPEVGMIYPE